MNQRGFTKILLIGIVVVLLGAATYFIFVQKQGSIPLPFSPAPVDSDNIIDSFIRSADFPESQGINISINIPEQNLKVFRISYGAPQDCPAGCFYSNATGIKYGDKIGWISINDYDHINVLKLVMYDFDASDTYLFTNNFFLALKTKDGWVYQNAFLPKLAEDKDVPAQVKEKINNLQ
ncbi:MAG: hypothetical protein AAB733_00350 [Patescibacteria group bacterium]|mgnify:FL=1